MLGLRRPERRTTRSSTHHPMTDETVDCFNCGRANPGVGAGVPIVRRANPATAKERTALDGPDPDRSDSLISIAAPSATILVAVLIGLFIAGLNPTDPSVGLATPTPEPTARADAGAERRRHRLRRPRPPHRRRFRFRARSPSERRSTRIARSSIRVETFTPSMTFALLGDSCPEPFGADLDRERGGRLDEDGRTGHDRDQAQNQLGRRSCRDDASGTSSAPRRTSFATGGRASTWPRLRRRHARRRRKRSVSPRAEPSPLPVARAISAQASA